MAYQHKYGLPITGVVDDATKKDMALPRCGVADIQRQDYGNAFYVPTNARWRWNKKYLTYRFINYGKAIISLYAEKLFFQV